ncbi:hypothetical protein MHB54_05940 [Paenibacillus sp. FSL M7-0802]|uniref:hypothetical protein n=1 Tax=Paenibacillus TaxID=44249 RepID=UPI0003D3456E|nr:hypothetical protein [Paenibacillus polymyxa]AHC22714.1 hypothetical protein X809_07160 [Paenibacillus polymyxa CR1]
MTLSSEILSEFAHRMGEDTELIYNARHKGVTIIVGNMGYGDVYVSTSSSRKSHHRVQFKGKVAFEDTSKLYLTSSSQPVISILEII